MQHSQNAEPDKRRPSTFRAQDLLLGEGEGHVVAQVGGLDAFRRHRFAACEGQRGKAGDICRMGQCRGIDGGQPPMQAERQGGFRSGEAGADAMPAVAFRDRGVVGLDHDLIVEGDEVIATARERAQVNFAHPRVDRREDAIAVRACVRAHRQRGQRRYRQYRPVQRQRDPLRDGDRQAVVSLLEQSQRPTAKLALALALGGGKPGEQIDFTKAHALMEELSKRSLNDLETALTRGRARAWLKQNPESKDKPAAKPADRSSDKNEKIEL